MLDFVIYNNLKVLSYRRLQEHNNTKLEKSVSWLCWLLKAYLLRFFSRISKLQGKLFYLQATN